MASNTIDLNETLQLSDVRASKLEKSPLEETLSLEDEVILNLFLGLFESLNVQDKTSFSSIRKELLETLDLAEEVSFECLKQLSEIGPKLIDRFYSYQSKAHQTFEIELYRGGKTLAVDKGDVIRFEVNRVLSDEVGGGFIEFDNSKTLTYRTGDEIRIYWGTEEIGIPKLIFSGEVDNAKKKWIEEEAEQRLTLEFQDWGKILLERKITKSYPKATNINTIINEILAPVKTINDPPYPNERKINLDYVTSSPKTRTVDFVGESLFDCLKKLAFITQSEFYVDPHKRLRFFPRSLQTTEETLTIDDFADYRFQTKEDEVANTVQVYGHPNKPYPWNLDSLWTEGIADWDISDYPGVSIGTDPTKKKAGNVSIKIWKGEYSGEIILGAECDLGSNVDLTTKQRFTKLKWANRLYVPSSATSAYVKNVFVFLEDANNRAVEYTYKDYPTLDRESEQINFVEMELPVGPDHEEEGEWESTTGREIPLSQIRVVDSYDETENTSPRDKNETKVVDSFLGGKEPYSVFGSPPYLNIDDGDDNAASVGLNGECTFSYYDFSSSWNFGNVEITKVTLYIKGRKVGIGSGPYVEMYIDVGAGWVFVGGFTETSENYVERSFDITSQVDTYAKANALKMKFVRTGGEEWYLATYSKVVMEGKYHYVTTDGTSPYLNTDDEDANRVGITTDGVGKGTIGAFSFQNLTESWEGATITSNTLMVRCKWSGEDTLPTLKTYIDHGTGWILADSRAINQTTYQGILIDLSSEVNTFEKVNNLKVKFVNDTLGGPNFIYITYAEMTVKGSNTGAQFSSGTFDWSKVRKVHFQWNLYRDDASIAEINIDWLHFDEGKWYGVYSDSDSMREPPLGYGVRYKEIFDDTLYSDTAAGRWAKETVLKYKEPIDYLINVELLKENMELINPGDIYSINVPELKGVYEDFLVKELIFKWDDEEMFEVRTTFEEV